MYRCEHGGWTRHERPRTVAATPLHAASSACCRAVARPCRQGPPGLYGGLGSHSRAHHSAPAPGGEACRSAWAPLAAAHTGRAQGMVAPPTAPHPPPLDPPQLGIPGSSQRLATGLGAGGSVQGAELVALTGGARGCWHVMILAATCRRAMLATSPPHPASAPPLPAQTRRSCGRGSQTCPCRS